MLIETRILGKKSRPLDGWAIPTPPNEPGDGGDGLTLRGLIERVVRAEVRAAEHRDRTRRFVRVLSEREVLEQSVRGKVDPGGRPSTGAFDEERAVASALQGFADGLYLVILDGVEQRDLAQPVFLTDSSRLVFLRLTFLAGA